MLDPVSAIIGVAQAIGTLGAVAVALWLGLRQRKADREALYNAQRPILVPILAEFGHADKKGRTSIERFIANEHGKPEFNFNANVNYFPIRNVGPGTALNVDGILMEPEPSPPSTTLARSYRLELGAPIAAGDSAMVYASQGGTMLHGTAQVIPGQDLYGPRSPSGADRLRGVGAVSVRLTLTCSDVFGRVYGFIYDYAEDSRWVYRTSQTLDKSIEELNRVATAQMIPGPSDIPEMFQDHMPTSR